MKQIYVSSDAIQKLKSSIDTSDTILGSDGASWEQNVKEVAHQISTGDKDSICSFLEWGVIRKTMFVGECDWVTDEYNQMKSNQRYLTAMDENDLGRPQLLSFNSNTSGNLVHNLYSLYFFEKYFNLDVSKDVDFIFEFGGGYGSMCRGVYQSGYTGDYLIYDLKSFSALQDFYLSSIGINKYKCVSDYEVLHDLLNSRNKSERKMFVATWSLSESPVSIRNKIIELLNDFKFILIIFSGVHDGVDNLKYFNSVGINGIDFKIEQHPYCIHGKFFMGSK